MCPLTCAHMPPGAGRRSGGWLALAFLVWICAFGAGEVAAQTNCELVQSRNLVNLELGTGRASYISAPRIRCQDGTRIQADSAAVFQASGFTQLFGAVLFEDEETLLTADRAHFFNQQARLLAWGGVSLENRANRSVITGDTLVLLRANDFRPEDRLTVSGNRPRALLRPARGGDGEDPAAEDSQDDLSQVDAHRIYLEGENLFRAGGEVELTRDDLLVTADSMEYVRMEGEITFLSLVDAPPSRITGEGFQLEGRELDVLLPGDSLRNVWARGEALLTGDDFRLAAPLIQIDLESGEVQRGVALRGEAVEGEAESPRPEALAQDFLLRGDSIEIVAPGQEIREVVAVGSARGEHLGQDSLVTDDTPEVVRRDWMEGDTIRATFLPPTDEDTDGGARMEQLVASGTARSLYRLEPSQNPDAEAGIDAGGDDAAGERVIGFEEEVVEEVSVPLEEREMEPLPEFAVHYVTGSRIVIFFQSGEVERMEVEGPTRGLHLEPGRTTGGTR
ncbi:MAG: hypothetical protein WEA09_07285 [Gemmatimonadota bacterium]